ncbi:MAG: hypothetical protein JW727_02820 [Candidatus Aenigmarchaeota archaeon]|nr:hypothetical protein [Candidatus Aenigmarchaeota archaeon]
MDICVQQTMDIEHRILEILEKNSEGVTLLELASWIEVHRHTLTKYVYKLEGENRIKIRKVGIAKLCYLADRGCSR